MGVAGQGENGGRGPGPTAVGAGPEENAQEEKGEADAVGVRELPREGARDRAAPDRVVFQVEEDEGRRGTQQRRGEGQAHQPEGGVDEERQEEDAEHRAELEGDRHAGERGQGRHQNEGEGEVVEEQGVPQRGAGVPPVEPELREEALVEPDGRGVVARSVSASGDRGHEQE